MITATTVKATWAAVAVASLTLLFGMAQQVNAADQLTKKQAKALAATAKTSADHMKLAAYFKLEADRLDAQAKEHEELARNYRLNPSTGAGGKTGRKHARANIRTLRSHCEIAPGGGKFHKRTCHGTRRNGQRSLEMKRNRFHSRMTLLKTTSGLLWNGRLGQRISAGETCGLSARWRPRSLISGVGLEKICSQLPVA